MKNNIIAGFLTVVILVLVTTVFVACVYYPIIGILLMLSFVFVVLFSALYPIVLHKLDKRK